TGKDPIFEKRQVNNGVPGAALNENKDHKA
ncbi:unnamed protein product, partial [marine sediment metagenome]